MRKLPILVLLVVALFGPGIPAGQAKSPDRKDVFKKIAKAWKKGEVKKITALLPRELKVKLALYGVKSKMYRREQAKVLIEKYFKAIDTKEFKSDEKTPRGASARFKHTYKVKPNRREETHVTFITLEREENRWVIVEILED